MKITMGNGGSGGSLPAAEGGKIRELIKPPLIKGGFGSGEGVFIKRQKVQGILLKNIKVSPSAGDFLQWGFFRKMPKSPSTGNFLLYRDFSTYFNNVFFW